MVIKFSSEVSLAAGIHSACGSFRVRVYQLGMQGWVVRFRG